MYYVIQNLFFKLFQVAYITITMANSPRPGVWTLERSSDHGKTWQPWQHFAGNDAECQKYFNMHADEKIVADDQERPTTTDLICIEVILNF